MLRKGDGADDRVIHVLFAMGCCASPLAYYVFAQAFPGSEQSNPATLFSIAISACLLLCGLYAFTAMRNTSDVTPRRVLLGIYLFFNVALAAAMLYVYYRFFERQASSFMA